MIPSARFNIISTTSLTLFPKRNRKQNRTDADYNLLKEWQPGQVSLVIEAVEDAFKSWHTIREEQAAKDFLNSHDSDSGEEAGSKRRPKAEAEAHLG